MDMISRPNHEFNKYATHTNVFPQKPKLYGKCVFAAWLLCWCNWMCVCLHCVCVVLVVNMAWNVWCDDWRKPKCIGVIYTIYSVSRCTGSATVCQIINLFSIYTTHFSRRATGKMLFNTLAICIRWFMSFSFETKWSISKTKTHLCLYHWNFLVNYCLKYRLIAKEPSVLPTIHRLAICHVVLRTKSVKEQCFGISIGATIPIIAKGTYISGDEKAFDIRIVIRINRSNFLQPFRWFRNGFEPTTYTCASNNLQWEQKEIFKIHRNRLTLNGKQS